MTDGVFYVVRDCVSLQHLTDMKATGVGTTELNRDISDKLNANATAIRYVVISYMYEVSIE